MLKKSHFDSFSSSISPLTFILAAALGPQLAGKSGNRSEFLIATQPGSLASSKLHFVSPLSADRMAYFGVSGATFSSFVVSFKYDRKMSHRALIGASVLITSWVACELDTLEIFELSFLGFLVKRREKF